MGRIREITAEGTVEAIRSGDEPFASTGDIADHFDVTRQAVRDQQDRLAADERITVGTVSNNAVFYIAKETPNADTGGYKITVDEMIQALGEIAGPATAEEIADECGVTATTVRNHRDELKAERAVDHKKIDRATVYWLAGGIPNKPDRPKTSGAGYTCPNCRGEFPRLDSGACPWCGQEVGEAPQSPVKIARTEVDDSDCGGERRGEMRGLTDILREVTG